MDNLDSIAEAIREELEAKNAARDDALARSRSLIRHCANTIKAIHREKWEEADSGLRVVQEAAEELIEDLRGHPDLYYTGYTQDALKEYVEVFCIHALVRGALLPTPAELGVPGSTYLNGLAEAASELRRTILDTLRLDHNVEIESLMDSMEDIYNVLMTFDFPDAVTGGLRHRVDNLRGVAQRTRGDLTSSIRQWRLEKALNALERRLALTNNAIGGGTEED
jgi:translin